MAFVRPVTVLHLVCLVAGILLSGIAAASAGILITPQRVVFAEGDRSSEVVINNVSDKTLVYRLSWFHLRMGENGRYVKYDPETEQFPHADALVRFSPRQVTLAPGQSQTVRLVLRRKSDLAQGEYRSHLLFQAIPRIDPNQTTDEEGIQMRLQLLLGFSIPVIVRVGQLNVVAGMTGTRIEAGPDGDLMLKVDVSREGAASPYGRLRALWRAVGEDPRQIGIVNNVAVFPEISTRRVEFPLSDRPTGPGQLLVRYEGLDEYDGQVFAEQAFRVE
ncbi:MAG: molecular chaperone [Alphaproteobacteria bacterium]